MNECRATEYPALLLDQFRMAAEQALTRTEELTQAWQSEPQQQHRLLTSVIQLMVSGHLSAERVSRGAGYGIVTIPPCWTPYSTKVSLLLRECLRSECPSRARCLWGGCAAAVHISIVGRCAGGRAQRAAGQS